MPSVYNRKKTRNIFYQELFAKTFWKVDLEAFYSSFFDDFFDYNRDDKYLEEMREIIKTHEGFFIFVIEKYSLKFWIEKMSVSNIIPIYIALAEIFYLKEEIPQKVSIDEAIWLVKIFSDDSSRKLVNGVLNKVLVDYSLLEKEKENHDDTNYSIFK